MLLGVNRRSAEYRRFKDLVRSYVGLAGQEHQELCRQLAILEMRREALEAASVRGEAIDDLVLVRICNAVNRTRSRLGFTRQVEPEADHRRREQEDREAGLVP